MPNSLAVIPLLLACVAVSSQAKNLVAGNGPYPETVLTNRVLKTTLYLPDPEKGYYRGTRFDWSGLVSRVEFGSHSFFCEFKQQHDPLNHDDICGTAEEFGIESAPSYAEAQAGEAFIKIGS